MARDKIAESDHRTFGIVIRNADQIVIDTATLVLMGGWRKQHEPLLYGNLYRRAPFESHSQSNQNSHRPISPV
ncbi:hypothetical protein [Bosea sp. (in: a-proteobacteria)]|uniref:hypothetical protein n=1 Tax=Bosea sp. (in: a-proteobacteria) TaxID=1871050 RepID=UPI003F6FA6F4